MAQSLLIFLCEWQLWSLDHDSRDTHLAGDAMRSNAQFSRHALIWRGDDVCIHVKIHSRNTCLFVWVLQRHRRHGDRVCSMQLHHSSHRFLCRDLGDLHRHKTTVLCKLRSKFSRSNRPPRARSQYCQREPTTSTVGTLVLLSR